MLGSSYRKRLEADLIRWVDGGLLSADSAGAIRRSVAREQGGFRLPALLGLLGGLLIAASVAAFVAANWEASGLLRYSRADADGLAALLLDPRWTDVGLVTCALGLKRLARLNPERVRLPAFQIGVS